MCAASSRATTSTDGISSERIEQLKTKSPAAKNERISVALFQSHSALSCGRDTTPPVPVNNGDRFLRNTAVMPMPTLHLLVGYLECKDMNHRTGRKNTTIGHCLQVHHSTVGRLERTRSLECPRHFDKRCRHSALLGRNRVGPC